MHVLRRQRSVSRTIVVLACVLALVQPGPATGTPSYCHVPPEERPKPLPEPIEACQRMTFDASSPGFVRITLPEAISLQNPWITGQAEFSLEGEGDFIGFALVEDVPGLTGDVWFGGRLPESASSRSFLFRLGFWLGAEPAIHELPEGTYRLFLLPGTGPVTLTLTLDAFSGEIDGEVPHPVRYVSTFPEEVGAANLVPHVYSVHGSQELRGPGALFEAAWFETETRLVTEADACFYDGPAQEPWGSLPACTALSIVSMGNLPPGQVAGEARTSPGPDLDRQLNLFYSDIVPAQWGYSGPQTWGQTLNIETVAQVESIDSLALWLDFDEVVP